MTAYNPMIVSSAQGDFWHLDGLEDTSSPWKTMCTPTPSSFSWEITKRLRCITKIGQLMPPGYLTENRVWFSGQSLRYTIFGGINSWTQKGIKLDLLGRSRQVQTEWWILNLSGRGTLSRKRSWFRHFGMSFGKHKALQSKHSGSTVKGKHQLVYCWWSQTNSTRRRVAKIVKEGNNISICE